MQFISETTVCDKQCDGAAFNLCSPDVWQNGFCEPGCNNILCDYDGGGIS